MSDKYSGEQCSPRMGTVVVDERASDSALTSHGIDLLVSAPYPHPGTPSIVDGDDSRARPGLMAARLTDWEGEYAAGRPSSYPLDGNPSGPECYPLTYRGDNYNPVLYLPNQRYTSPNGSYGGDQSNTDKNSAGCDQLLSRAPYACSSVSHTPSSPAAYSDPRFPDPLGSPAMSATPSGFYTPSRYSAVRPGDIQHDPDYYELDTTMYPPDFPATSLPRTPDYLQDLVVPRVDVTARGVEEADNGKPYGEGATSTPAVVPALGQQDRHHQREQQVQQREYPSPLPLSSAASPRRLHPPFTSLRPTPSSCSAGPSSPALSTPGDITPSRQPAVATGTRTPGSRQRPPYAGRGSTRGTKRKSGALLGLSYDCVFAPYGCKQSFEAKNEWKRHVSTIHLQLDLYRCDVDDCGRTASSSDAHESTTVATTLFDIGYPATTGKVYNRKDLFTQHLKRMHADWPEEPYQPTKEELAAFKAKVKRVHERCCTKQRDPPQKSVCPYCGCEFGQPISWDTRMEHVAGHIEQCEPPICEDRPLNDWALQHGVLKFEGEALVLVGQSAGRKRRT